MLREDPIFYLPNLYTFQNGNTFLGSYRGLRFRVVPAKGDKEAGTQDEFEVLVWLGPLCLERSEPAGEARFPLTQEGWDAVVDYLEAEWVRLVEKTGETPG